MMQYIIFDLEFNQSKETKEERKDKEIKLIFEIIQIGAVKVDKDFNIISKFNALIKPTLYTELHPYVENLTNINISNLKKAKMFSEVFNEFIEFIGNDNPVLCVWGTSDIKELIKNASFHKFPLKLIPKKYIDVQKYASKDLKCEKGRKIGLKTAVETLKINTDLNFHDAYCDAIYTYEVFKRIFTHKIVTELYNFNTVRREKKKKEVVNFPALFKQFEKKYKRNLTKEDMEMIKLSYMMGRTKQFLKEK
ncbi:exonuclease domain-containing protein [Clostridium sp.]|uniref:exonuclease domain-containing protein n=1 Tax=Clostridium sp. TaxID=1506 RepID=UPI0039913C81